ncbi:helix-turn-helix domain-containing protein [Streptomyces enissocaesilis]|uniref:HTH araC/xylS-type domain-containing protein n=1 Tax=Streptomyces enissocaesilis TaxID=332589 RepID=A0ABP6K056_9ACTN
MSARHPTRPFRDRTGTSPAGFVEGVRLEAARVLLEGGAGVTGAAARSGTGSDESPRRAFARRFGVAPSAYAARFRGTAVAGGGYPSTLTSSSVITPSTMRNERNWKGPASSVSAVETRT